MKYQFSLSVILGVALGFALVASVSFAFTPPAQAPPGGNVAAPLNTGPDGQSKLGGLILNTGGAALGLIVDKGFVGIGTLNPTSLLELENSGDTDIHFDTKGSGNSATFNYTGSEQTFVVPQGVTSLTVDVRGGAGGFGQQGTGGAGASGLGGRIEATLQVSPGETLRIYVGGQGANGLNGGSGGFNGGGNGGGGSKGGGGGGASDIRQGGSALASRIVAAGGAGGGGGGGNCVSDPVAGGNGGNGGGSIGIFGGNGEDASRAVCSDPEGGHGGGGGTLVGGGSGGSGGHITSPDGFSGSLGQGGGGGDANSGGGGGGGGYYGGGGGEASVGPAGGGGGGGGGGSGFCGTNCSSPTYSAGFQSGNGQVIVTYTSEGVSWTIGGDQSDNANFKISNSTALGTSDRLVLDGTGLKVTSGYSGGTVGALDYAELYSASEKVEAGDLLEVDPQHEGNVRKAVGAYSPFLVGAVSANPAIVIEGDQVVFTKDYKADARKPAVALAGRVQVKVSAENGSIAPGDAITSSSVPGVGMKATKDGLVVGIALGSFPDDGSVNGKIFVLINPHWRGASE